MAFVPKFEDPWVVVEWRINDNTNNGEYIGSEILTSTKRPNGVTVWGVVQFQRGAIVGTTFLRCSGGFAVSHAQYRPL